MFRPIRPSELDTFATCQRKWGYIYLDECKQSPSPAAMLGTAVHKVLEKYLRGENVDFSSKLGQIAKPGLIYLPKSIPEEFIEQKIKFTFEGRLFTGTPDFIKPLGENNWLLGDHKTCSSFSSALTPQSLRTNIQAITYAQWLFQEKKAEKVHLRWVYYRTKGTPKAQCVETEIKKEEQTSLFDHLLEIASDIMATLARKPNSVDLPKNLDACFKYGRCPFYGPCKANQSPAATHPIENIKMQVSSAYVSAIAKSQLQQKNNSFHLFVDCMPTKFEDQYDKLIELSEFIKPVLEKIHTEKNLSHYRLAGYGQHVGLMAHYLEEYLKENNFSDRTAVLSSSKTPEGIDTLQTLSAAASRVVRGF
ncbi:MAG: PD-(D/E)XK nuclease family protein [Myxococcales bacterium]|nr:PD-(D/E)XK nuclease family protein [Myxococcales bacterium]